MSMHVASCSGIETHFSTFPVNPKISDNTHRGHRLGLAFNPDQEHLHEQTMVQTGLSVAVAAIFDLGEHVCVLC